MQRLPRAAIFAIALLVLSLGCAAYSPAQTSEKKQSKSSASSGSKVDLNTASEAELDALPGVGPATAKKIIAARPYASVEELSKSGIPASTVKKITPLVTVSGPADGTPGSARAQSETSQAPPSQAAPESRKPASSSAAPSPAPGMVWVNLDSGVYHYERSQYYGKTKNGKYMSESDAIKAGYRAAKNEKKPQG